MTDRKKWFVPHEGIWRKNLVNFDDDKPKDGVTVALYGYYNERYDPLAEIAEANWSEYCLRNNYALRMYPGAYDDLGTTVVKGDREKFTLYHDIRGLFEKVMYLDIDSVFVGMDRKIEDVSFGMPFLWTYDDNGPNSSVLIAKTDDVTERHLRFAYERAKVTNNVKYGLIEPGGISDQDSMRDIMNIPPFRDTFHHCYEAGDVGVCYTGEPKDDTWVVTCAGLSLEQKLERMKKYYASQPS